jgi:4-diphosphocytidyl-2-C-methyl-D-erythritol kinase
MAAAKSALTELAPAKVNLYLHLRGRRADGYHLLDSLVVFPAIGDRLTAAAGQGLSLRIDGPFGAGLAADPDNLVLRAARALAKAHAMPPNAALRLEKHLPIASGIGGGSSDAAGALRLLSRLWGVDVPEELALSLGADVPVCLAAPQPRLMAGIGEHLSPAPPMPDFWMVLANPGVAVATGAVFAAVNQRDNPSAPPMPSLTGFAALIDWLAQQRNDLQPAAISACPAIAEVLAALSDAPLARMSGSGATPPALRSSRLVGYCRGGGTDPPDLIHCCPV